MQQAQVVTVLYNAKNKRIDTPKRFSAHFYLLRILSLTDHFKFWTPILANTGGALMNFQTSDRFNRNSEQLVNFYFCAENLPQSAPEIFSRKKAASHSIQQR